MAVPILIGTCSLRSYVHIRSLLFTGARIFTRFTKDEIPPVPVPPENKGQFVGAKDRECVHPNRMVLFIKSLHYILLVTCKSSYSPVFGCLSYTRIPVVANPPLTRSAPRARRDRRCSRLRQVDQFARVVKADPKLQSGFNAAAWTADGVVTEGSETGDLISPSGTKVFRKTSCWCFRALAKFCGA